MNCQGKQLRDICPYRFEEFCFYVEYEGNDVEPCEKQHLVVMTTGSIADPLGIEEILKGIREVENFLKRQRFRVVK